jgi:hypothetical protein
VMGQGLEVVTIVALLVAFGLVVLVVTSHD